MTPATVTVQVQILVNDSPVALWRVRALLRVAALLRVPLSARAGDSSLWKGLSA
jgi:hypothetical protein